MFHVEPGAGCTCNPPNQMLNIVRTVEICSNDRVTQIGFARREAVSFAAFLLTARK